MSIVAPPEILERVRAANPTRHYSSRSETAYVGWIRHFILIHRKRHPGGDRGAIWAGYRLVRRTEYA